MLIIEGYYSINIFRVNWPKQERQLEPPLILIYTLLGKYILYKYTLYIYNATEPKVQS